MTPLTLEERKAIAAYTGPVTVCPPHTFTEGMFYANGGWHREGGETFYSKVHNKIAAKGKATTDHIRLLMEEGLTHQEIAKHMGLSIEATRVHMKRAQNGA